MDENIILLTFWHPSKE